MTHAQLTEFINETFAGVLGRSLEPGSIRVSLNADLRFGDYSTNAAMVYAKLLDRPARELAEELAQTLKNAHESIEKVEVAGPGFINISLSSKAVLAGAVAAVAFAPDVYRDQTIVVEYSDPNPFKPLHAGHLYTTLVGDVIAKLLEGGGAQVTRLSYGGDVGMHVAKSMWAIVHSLGGENPGSLANVPAAERADWLGARYVEGNSAYEDDPTSKQEIAAFNARIYALHAHSDHSSDFAKIYWTTREWSYDYFPELYRQLEIVPFDRIIPESEVTELGVTTVQTQLEAGIYERSDGAVIFRGEPYGLHTRVFINSQGLPVYETKDVGLLLTKWRDYKFDRSIVITSNEQEQYMAVMLKSVEQFMPEPALRSRHITHGVVKLLGGVKMSSRKGNTVGALDILEAARLAAKAASPDFSTRTVLAAVKYAFLKQKIGGDIIYDPAESVSLEGNSGPYLQYAHARARSILAKAKHVEEPIILSELDPAERILAFKIAEYADVLERSTRELLPHYITTYLYETAQTFNRFYEVSRVIGDPREMQRLHLVALYADVLQHGLVMLGIDAPQRM